MTTTSRDRISVDLRGLKATLFERARASGVSPSGLLRDIVVEALGSADAGAGGLVKTAVPMPSGVRVRLTLRMNRNEAVAVIAAARLAGLTPGAYVAGMLAGVPVLTLGVTAPTTSPR